MYVCLMCKHKFDDEDMPASVPCSVLRCPKCGSYGVASVKKTNDPYSDKKYCGDCHQFYSKKYLRCPVHYRMLRTRPIHHRVLRTNKR